MKIYKMLLSDVLKNLDEKLDNQGERKVFSIKFVKRNGEIVFYNRAVSTGAKADLSKNAMRAVMQIDAEGKSIDTPKMVKIWNIIEFNSQKVNLK